MDSLAIDRDHRRQALDTHRSFIVQAPAGSGKTELLIQRFLALLAEVDQPEAVVAITFTRKAAAEMRHRVVTALDLASGPAPETDHEKLTWALAKGVVARNSELQWHLTEQPSRLRIQTIDSLCSLLVRQMPLRSQMGTDLAPTDNAGHLYMQAAYGTLAMLDSDRSPDVLTDALSSLLSYQDNNYAKVAAQLSLLLGRRQDWLHHVEEKQGTALRAKIEASLLRIVEHDLKRLHELFPERHRQSTVELVRFAADNLENACIDSPLRACFQLEVFPSTSATELPIWRGLAEMFLTKSGGLRKSLNKNQGFPTTADGKAAKARFKTLELDSNTQQLLHKLRNLPPVRFEDGHWAFFIAIIHVLKEAVSQLRDTFLDNQQVDFAEIALAARNALGSDSSDAFSIFGSRIRHLLVDEFQDTSQSQFGFLTQLVSGWQPDDGRTVFLVGDPMQSIYGFREAEVELFLRAKRSGVGNLRLEPLNLSANFRSYPAIVDWVNGAFVVAFPDIEDSLTGAVSYGRSQSSRVGNADSGVHIHSFIANEPDAEADCVLEIIEEAHKKNRDGTVAVLVRSRSHLTQIVAKLRNRGTRFRAVEIDALGGRPVVRDLQALWQALQNTGHRVAWMSVLRAPWCGLSLADLHVLVGGRFDTAVWDRVCNDSVLAKLSADGQTRLERVRSALKGALAQRARLSVRTWLEDAWIALGGPACLQSKTELDEAIAFLEFLEQSQSGFDINDEKLFERNLARLFAPPDTEAGDRLQIMTIHGAKGLEFDTVILPGLSRTPRGGQPALVRWREYLEDGDVNLIMAPTGTKVGEGDPLYRFLGSINNRRRDHESTRLLYVAATRAKENLHLLGNVNSNSRPAKSSLLNKVWHVVKDEFDGAANDATSAELQQEAATDDRPGVPLLRLTSDWVPVALPEDATWRAKPPVSDSETPQEDLPKFDWVRDLQRRVGTVVHGLLKQMRAPHKLAFDENILYNALKAEGVGEERLKDARSRATEALQNTIKDKTGLWILAQHELDEWEFEVSVIVNGKSRLQILDRTFVENGTRWIIDYKTSRHKGDMEEFLNNEQERYRNQLEGYARAMQTFDARPIMLGLFYPMIQGWREWAFTQDSK